MPEEETRFCPALHHKGDRNVPVSGFSKNLKRPSGLQGWCKACMNANSKRWYADNPYARQQEYERRKERARLAELRPVTEETMTVVYAVRLSFEGGAAGLEEADTWLAAAVERAFPRDPLLKITRGDMVSLDGNPYPSAGFLHGGEPRIGDLPSPYDGAR